MNSVLELKKGETMRKEYIVGIAIRLFAIFLVIYALRQVSGLIPFLADSQPMKVSVMFVLLVTLVPIFVAVFLWLLPLTDSKQAHPQHKSRGITFDAK